MKKKVIRKSVLPTILALVLSMVIASMGTVSSTQTTTTTIYLDPPTINGTAIGVNGTITVNINIRDANISLWQVGLTFNPDVLNCTGFYEGEFLKSAGSTLPTSGTINNTAGVITPHSSTLLAIVTASGDGRLAYVNFTVIAPGFSDLHLYGVSASRPVWNPITKKYGPKRVEVNIIDVYTVVADTTPHTVVTVSNSTGFHNHAFSVPDQEISFNVTSIYTGFSNVTIPKTLLNVSTLDEWTVIIDGLPLSTEERTVKANATHHFIYFTYSSTYGKDPHTIQITTERRSQSIISITLSSTNVTLGSNMTISGAITPLLPGFNITVVNLTIQFRPNGTITWNTLANVATDENGNYSYTWTPETIGTYELKARWEGYENILGDESDPPYPTLTVKGLPLKRYPYQVSWEGEVFYVLIESNSTVSDFYFNQPTKEIGFNGTGLSGNEYFCNVTIPEELLWCDEPEEWRFWVDAVSQIPIIKENATHTFVSFKYTHSIRKIQIFGTHVILQTSTISINLSLTSVTSGSDVTISGAIDPVRAGVNVTIWYRPSGETDWTFVANATTDSDGNYNYTWTPEEAGTYELKASWEGDDITLDDESDPPYPTLTVKGASGIPLEIVAAAVVAIIVIIVIVVYFVKIRKPK